MNKKADWLLDNLGKIIIAVLVIVLLIILAVKLYGMFTKENDVRTAEDNLNIIKEKIDFLISKDYTKNSLYAIVFPPIDWNLRSYNKFDQTPKECAGKFESCLCICKNAECTSLKACKSFENEVVVENTPLEEEKRIIRVIDPEAMDCRYWYQGDQWNSNIASSCIDLSGLNYEDGFLKIKTEHEKIKIDEILPLEVIQFMSSTQELKISQEEDIIIIKQGDRTNE